MKSLKLIFASLIFTLVISGNIFAENPPKILAVVNSAEWCSVCKAHGQRAMGAFMENNKDGAIQFIMNDLSNAESQKKSAIELKKAGISASMKNYKASGIAYFFDAKTKTPITQITVANTNDEIAYVIGEVKKAVK